MRKLRRLRAEKGLTMDALEERSGVSKRSISEIERGMRTPQTLTLAKLANALGVGLDALLEDESPKVRPLSLAALRTFLEGHLGSSWLALPEEEWDGWWRGVSKEEAAERFSQIRAEWELLQAEWLATHGKAKAEPRLVPRGRSWGEVYFTLWGRHFGAVFRAPQKGESEEEFLARSTEGRAIDAFYQDPVQKQREEEERTLRVLVGPQA